MKILYVDPVVYVDGDGISAQAFVRAYDPFAGGSQSLQVLTDDGWGLISVPKSSTPTEFSEPASSSWYAPAGSRFIYVAD